MKTLRDILGPDAAPEDAGQRLQEAYQAFERGQASKEDSDLILFDLLQFTGYYSTTHAAADAGQVKFAEGQRSVAARILWMIDAPVTLIREYAKAATRG